MRQGPILVVEDIPNILEMLAVTLRFKGYEVLTALNGVIGLEIAEKTPPALIITDILMPRMDGYAFVQKLRTSNLPINRTPVIFLSATYITPEDKIFALSLGATHFVEKPIETDDFLETIAKIMAEDETDLPEPLRMQDFYKGYRERLESKLRQKNTQIARAERLIPNLNDEERLAFEIMMKQSTEERDGIQDELTEVYKKLDQLNSTGK